MNTIRKEKKQSSFEFIALMASLMSIVALAMDALLPALGAIGESIGVNDPSQNQLLITMIFLGLGIGQLIAGPLSDSLGRKPVTYMGFGVFILASLLCVTATRLEWMIVGRLLQGIGLAAPRTISMAIVRDLYKGDQMARIMSFVVVIFILVPAVAPAYGKVLLDAFGWQSIFYSQMLIGVVVIIWFALRQNETLPKAHKTTFSMHLLWNGARLFFKSKQATMYTIILGVVTGSFLVFLSTAQTVLGTHYNMEDEFPYLFAAVALAVGISTFFNGMLVVKFGMRKLVVVSSFVFTSIALVYTFLYSGRPNPEISVLLGFLIALFLSFGFLFGNLTSLAMEPLGKNAGIGAAMNGFVSTLIAVPIAGGIGGCITDTAWPLFVGFFTTGIVAVILLLFAAPLHKRG